MHNSPRQYQGSIQRFIIKRTVHNSFCQSQGNIQSFTFFWPIHSSFCQSQGNMKDLIADFLRDNQSKIRQILVIL